MIDKTLASELINAIDKSDYDRILDLIARLPHGSGIDCKWEYGPYYINNSYHVMSDTGYYMGYIDFKINLKTLKLTFQTNSKGYRWIDQIGLRDYLNDTVVAILDDSFK